MDPAYALHVGPQAIGLTAGQASAARAFVDVLVQPTQALDELVAALVVIAPFAGDAVVEVLQADLQIADLGVREAAATVLVLKIADVAQAVAQAGDLGGRQIAAAGALFDPLGDVVLALVDTARRAAAPAIVTAAVIVAAPGAVVAVLARRTVAAGTAAIGLGRSDDRDGGSDRRAGQNERNGLVHEMLLSDGV